MSRTSGARRHWAVFAGPQLICLAFAAHADTPLQLKPADTLDVWQVSLQAFLVAIFGLGLAAAALYGWRAWRRAQGISVGQSAGAHLEWARRISPRTTLLVVQWQGRRYLLTENSNVTQLLDSRALDGTEK